MRKIIKRNNLVNISARLDNIFGWISYSFIGVTVGDDKIKTCLFLNTNAITNTIINIESYTV